MIHCLSCKKYPDSKNIPYGSSFSTNVYKVNLISKNTPNNFDIDGSDVEELPDDCKFADGSRLYIVNGNDGSEVYVYILNKFVLYTSPIKPEEKPTSDLTDVGLVDYMILTE